jgi:hypothetical protein
MLSVESKAILETDFRRNLTVKVKKKKLFQILEIKHSNLKVSAFLIPLHRNCVSEQNTQCNINQLGKSTDLKLVEMSLLASQIK